MNRIKLIRRIIVLTVVVSGIALSQQSSNASQTVTFGVTRSSQQVLNNLFSAGSTTPSLSALGSANFREQHAAIAAKITVSAKPQQKSFQSLPTSSDGTSVGTSISNSTVSQRSEDNVQADLRTFVQFAKTFPSKADPLIITITE